MNKSQLRKLAVRRAQDGLTAEEYLRRRHQLIDQIIRGELAIEREVPPPRPVPVTDGTAAPGLTPDSTDGGPRNMPLHYYFAAAATICVLILIWALWPGADRPATPPSVPPPPVQKISAARTLVESFLALRDFSETAVTAFEESWQQLDGPDREQARHALWFRSLSRSIRDEVKTQRALAQLDASEDNQARIEPGRAGF